VVALFTYEGLVEVGSVLSPPCLLEECGYYRIPSVHSPFILVRSVLDALARPYKYVPIRGGPRPNSES